MFLIPSFYILKKKPPCQQIIRNKCVTQKINLYFFDVMKNGQIFLSKFCHFQYDNRFLFSREMENIRSCKEVRLQKSITFRLPGWYSFWYFSSCLKIKNHLGKNCPSHFLQNVLTET